MSFHASGTFEVKLMPQEPKEGVGDPSIGRLSIDKVFEGDLSATSKGEMLAVSTDVQDSAGYVALERVNGTLKGKRGTFALQHDGMMNRGTPSLTVTVVPDSGTGELTGLNGQMAIIITGDKHLYEFDYSL